MSFRGIIKIEYLDIRILYLYFVMITYPQDVPVMTHVVEGSGAGMVQIKEEPPDITEEDHMMGSEDPGENDVVYLGTEIVLKYLSGEYTHVISRYYSTLSTHVLSTLVHSE